MRGKEVSSWYVGAAAEVHAAALFASYRYDVSVQYGANQTEYNLIAVPGDKMLKISAKGSKDGSCGLTQSYKMIVNITKELQSEGYIKKLFSALLNSKIQSKTKCRGFIWPPQGK